MTIFFISFNEKLALDEQYVSLGAKREDAEQRYIVVLVIGNITSYSYHLQSSTASDQILAWEQCLNVHCMSFIRAVTEERKLPRKENSFLFRIEHLCLKYVVEIYEHILERIETFS